MISSDFGTIRIFRFFKNSFWLLLPLWTFPKPYSQRIKFPPKMIYFSKEMVFFFLSFWLLEKKTSYISLSFLQLSQRGPLTAICCSQLKRMLECLTVELLRNICDCHNEGLFSTSCDNWYVPQQNSVHKNFRNTLSFCCALAKQRLMINFSKINSTPFHRCYLLARFCA